MMGDLTISRGNMGNTASVSLRISQSVLRALDDLGVLLRKQNLEALAELGASAIQTRSANTSVWISALPRITTWRKSKENYIRRFPSNALISPASVMGRLAGDLIVRPGSNGSTVILALDQSKISDGFECPMMSVCIGKRTLPILWKVVKTKGAIGFGFKENFWTKSRKRSRQTYG